MKLQQRPSSTWKEKGAQRGWNPGEQLMIHISYPPTQGPLFLPWGASSRVCFHCAIQNKWKLQMRTGHLRNWNHEVHKKNTKNISSSVARYVCVFPSWSLWLCGDGGVCFTPRETGEVNYVYTQDFVYPPWDHSLFWHNLVSGHACQSR